MIKRVLIAGLLSIVSLAYVLEAPSLLPAYAQGGCQTQTEAQLLQALADNVQPGKITPQILRNIVCFSAGTASTFANPPAIGSITPNSVAATTLSSTGATTLSPANANVTLSPTGTGTVTIQPSTTGSINNETIGQTTPKAGTFTAINNTVGAGSALNGTLGATTPESVAATTVSATGLITPTSTVGIKATATNDLVQPGSVGEIAAMLVPATTTTVTITIAAPGIISWTAHGLQSGAAVYFSTSGALPTGLTAGTNYYVCSGATLLTNSFAVATTVLNAIAGTCLTTTGTQSGTQTGQSGANLASTTPANLGGLNLSAGDWDCRGTTEFIANSGTTISFLESGLSVTSATFQSIATGGATALFSATFATSSANAFSPGTTRVTLASAAPVYLVADATFATSTMLVVGNLSCRRMR